MKLDLGEINKLTPPGLLNLRPMLFVVEVMMQLVAREVPGSRMMLKLVRALSRYQRHARLNETYNLNVKIKAWVMALAERRAWVRGIIGEAAIRRWQWRRDNLYAPVLAKPCRPDDSIALKSKPQLGLGPYTWKRFAMADLSWLEIKPFPSLNKPLSTSFDSRNQSRESRGFKPVEFWAFELATDYEDYAPQIATITETKKVEKYSDNSEKTEPDPPPEQAQKLSGSNQKPEPEKPP